MSRLQRRWTMLPEDYVGATVQAGNVVNRNNTKWADMRKLSKTTSWLRLGSTSITRYVNG